VAEGGGFCHQLYAQAHHRVAEDYNHLLERIRAFPRFNSFLQPRKSAELCGTATSGPVVIVNVHKSRCDALVLHPSSPEVMHIPLPNFHLDTAQKLQHRLALLLGAEMIPRRHFKPFSEHKLQTPSDRNAEFSDILKQLWIYVAQPVLSHLGVCPSTPLP
jgi:hypothetical protein